MPSDQVHSEKEEKLQQMCPDLAGSPSIAVNIGSSARAARAPADNKPAGSENP